jgi:hypothetical protein
MSSYDPINEYVFAAALSGCVAGAVGAQPVTSSSEDVYAETSLTAFAFAQEFDTLWSTASLDVIQQAAILDMCTAYWYGRIPQTTTPAEYEDLCEALIAAVNEADATAIAGGATPPAYPIVTPPVVGRSGYIIYRPGGVAGTNVATTFAQLQAAVNASNGTALIYVDSSLGAATIPAGQTLTPPSNGQIQLASFNGVGSGGATRDVLTIEDTGVIVSLTLILGGLLVQCVCATAPALAYPNNTTQLNIRGFSELQVLVGATVPAYSAGAGVTFLVALEFVSFLESGAAVPVFEAVGGVIGVYAFSSSSINSAALGQSSGAAVFLYDASVTPPVFTIGTVTLDPQTLTENFGPTVTTTGGRPTHNLQPGQQSFDSTLGKPIWRNAGNTAWVDATGTPV